MIATRVGRRQASRVGGCCLGLVAAVALGSAFAQEPGNLVEKGQKVFVEQGCYGCHTIGKVGTQGMATDLSHIGAKRDLVFLKSWLADPSAQRPTAHMPKIQMSRADADAVATYLSSLR